MKKQLAWAGVISLVLQATTAAPGFCDAKAINIVPEASFVSMNMQVQNFSTQVTLTKEQAASPLTLKLSNGSYAGKKFAWVRVFVTAGAGSRSGPSGRMVASEQQFARASTISVDVTGKMQEGLNTIMAQGAGVPGAAINYSLVATSSGGGGAAGAPAALKLTAVEPTEVPPGGTITLKGTGFDSSPAKDIVTIYNRPCTVDKATDTELTVKTPSGLAPHSYTVDVTVNNVKSSKLQFDVTGNPEISSTSELALVPGRQVQVTGNNFSKVASKNVVTISVPSLSLTRTASVSTSTKDTLTITVPDFPELGDKLNGGVNTPCDVSVKVNGIAAPSTVYCVISIRQMPR
jgi:hypothetical protein